MTGSGWTESWRLPSGSSTSGAAIRSGGPGRATSLRQLRQRAVEQLHVGVHERHHRLAHRLDAAVARRAEAHVRRRARARSPARRSARATATLPSLEPESTTTTRAAGRWRSTERSSAASSRSESCVTVTSARPSPRRPRGRAGGATASRQRAPALSRPWRASARRRPSLPEPARELRVAQHLDEPGGGRRRVAGRVEPSHVVVEQLRRARRTRARPRAAPRRAPRAPRARTARCPRSGAGRTRSRSASAASAGPLSSTRPERSGCSRPARRRASSSSPRRRAARPPRRRRSPGSSRGGDGHRLEREVGPLPVHDRAQQRAPVRAARAPGAPEKRSRSTPGWQTAQPRPEARRWGRDRAPRRRRAPPRGRSGPPRRARAAPRPGRGAGRCAGRPFAAPGASERRERRSAIAERMPQASSRSGREVAHEPARLERVGAEPQRRGEGALPRASRAARAGARAAGPPAARPQRRAVRERARRAGEHALAVERRGAVEEQALAAAEAARVAHEQRGISGPLARRGVPRAVAARARPAYRAGRHHLVQRHARGAAQRTPLAQHRAAAAGAPPGRRAGGRPAGRWRCACHGPAELPVGDPGQPAEREGLREQQQRVALDPEVRAGSRGVTEEPSPAWRATTGS